MMRFLSLLSFFCCAFSANAADVVLDTATSASYNRIDPDEIPEHDPFEPINRVVFEFNTVVDGVLIKPMSKLLALTLHESVDQGVRRVIGNAFAPVSVINYALRADMTGAFETLSRFLINSTFGVFGLIDIAKEAGIEPAPRTFNGTLAQWGMGKGPYLVLPILGPSCFRDALGRVGDYFMNPLYYIAYNKKHSGNRHGQQRYWLATIYGVDALQRRATISKSLNQLESSAFDRYTAYRSVAWDLQDDPQ